MTPNPFLDSNTTDGFLQMTKEFSVHGIPAQSIFDTRFWCDYAIAPSHHFPYNFSQRPKMLERAFNIMRVFKPKANDYIDVRQFCDLAQGVYDVLATIKS